jgi:protease II
MASALWAPLQDILETPLELSKPLNVLELDGRGAPGKKQKYDYSA